MPRISQPLQCDCHIPTGASEDIKLKVMEEKLKTAIPGIKEIKYVSSEGLTDKYEIVYTNGQTSNYLEVTNGKPLNIVQNINQCVSIGDAYMADGSQLCPYGSYPSIASYGYLRILDDPANKELPTAWHVGSFVKGNQGLDGIGIAAITKTGTEGKVDTYTITYTSISKEETTFTVTNGEDGLTTKIKIGTDEYEHQSGTITLPDEVNGLMGESFVTNTAVGYLPAGTQINATDSIRSILKKILYAEKTLQNIYIATAPTKIAYLVGESFNPAGMVVKAHYNVGDDEIITNYTYSPSGVLTLNDNQIVVSFNGKTANQAITVSEPITDIDIWVGVSATVPPTMEGLTKKTVDKDVLLATAGYEQLLIAGNPETEEGEYPVFAIPNTLTVTYWGSKGFEQDIPRAYVASGNYDIHYITNEVYDEPDGTTYVIKVKEK